MCIKNNFGLLDITHIWKTSDNPFGTHHVFTCNSVLFPTFQANLPIAVVAPCVDQTWHQNKGRQDLRIPPMNSKQGKLPKSFHGKIMINHQQIATSMVIITTSPTQTARSKNPRSYHVLPAEVTSIVVISEVTLGVFSGQNQPWMATSSLGFRPRRSPLVVRRSA